MKNHRPFFAMILGLISILETSHGAPSGPPISAPTTKTNDQQNDSISPDGNQEKKTKPSPTAQGSRQVDNDRKKLEKVTGKGDQVKPDTIPGVRPAQPAGPSANAAAAQPPGVEPIHTPTLRPLTVVAPLALAVKNERHLGANAAVVGRPAKTFGLTKTNVANAGINGTGLNHKH